MSDLSFIKGIFKCPTRYHGEVTLSQQKWERICNQLERLFYRYNGEKIPTTLVAPDYVRHHREITTQFIYYKRFESFRISEQVEGPQPCKYMAVVIDTETKRICTVYPVEAPKRGKEFRPKRV